MNKLTKTVLITSLALFASGIICTGAGHALNGRYEADNSRFHLNINGKEYKGKDNKKNKSNDKDNSKNKSYGNGRYGYGNDYRDNGGSYGYSDSDDIEDFFKGFGMGDDLFNEFFGDSGSSYYGGNGDSSSSEGENNSSNGRIYYY